MLSSRSKAFRECPLSPPPGLFRLSPGSVSPGYFDVFRIPLLRGRTFSAEHDEQAAGVVIINRAMMTKYWQEVDANPIGQFITIGKGMGTGMEEAPRQISGVVADGWDAGLDREPTMYVPVAQVRTA